MKKQAFILTIMVVVFALVSATAVFAQYTYRATYTISENGTASYDMLPVMVASNNQWMIDNGFILDADALDTRIETLGGLQKLHMITDTMTLTAVPVPTNSQTNLYFTTGNSLLSAFPIIIGWDGYITTLDHADIELGDNFTVEQSGWFDTTLTSPGTDVLHFDGSASAASNVNCGAIYNASPKLWLSFWFRLDALHANGSGNHYIFGKTLDGTNRIEIKLVNAGTMEFYKEDGGVAAFTLTSAETSWTADTWYHVIASMSSAAGARLRINNGTAVTNADTSAVCNGGDFVMGDYDDPGGGATGFVGELCNFVAGTDDLSAAEETLLYYGNAPSDATDYWYIDEGVGTNIISYGTAGNAGTVDTKPSWEISARPNPDRPFAVKPGAFMSSISVTSGNITSSIQGGPTVNATGISSGGYTVKTYGEVNNPVWATGNVLHFDGTATSGINCGAIYSANETVGLSFWFKLDSDFGAGAPANQYLWHKWVHENNRMYVLLSLATGKLAFTQVAGGVVEVQLSGQDELGNDITHWDADTWYHVVASVSAADGARLRVNNGIASTDGTSGAFPNGGNFSIGLRTDVPGTGVIGHIQNFIVVTDDLTTDEETALYNGIAPGDETDYWYIDEGTGTNIVSYGSQANAGTAGANTVWQTSTHTTGKTGRLCDFYLEVNGNRGSGGNVKAGVTNNSNSWIWMQDNTMAYADNITISVNGTERLRYEPITYIVGSNLPDLTGTSQNGTITWGTNPTGVTVSLGSLVSSSQPAPGVSVSRPAQDILPEVEVSDWFLPPDVSGTLLTNPARPFVIILSDNSTLTEIQSWRLLALAFILLVTVSTGKAVRGHHFITGVACAASLGGMVALTVLPMWALVFMILPLFAGLIAERSPSL